MTLYLYRIGTSVPVMTIEHVVSYTADHIMTEDGTVHSPLADGFELSSKEDCSETLRADWRKGHPEDNTRISELEEALALLLSGETGEEVNHEA